jgi:hypothetical protein
MKRRAATVPKATAIKISAAIAMSSSGDALVTGQILGSVTATR